MTTQGLRNRMIELRFRTLQWLDHVDRGAKTGAVAVTLVALLMMAAYLIY